MHPDAKVLIYTGGANCREEAYARAATGSIEKPFGLSELEREIAKVISRSGGSYGEERKREHPLETFPVRC